MRLCEIFYGPTANNVVYAKLIVSSAHLLTCCVFITSLEDRVCHG